MDKNDEFYKIIKIISHKKADTIIRLEYMNSIKGNKQGIIYIWMYDIKNKIPMV